MSTEPEDDEYEMDDDEEDLDTFVLLSNEETTLAREMCADWRSSDFPGWVTLPPAGNRKTAKLQRTLGISYFR